MKLLVTGGLGFIGSNFILQSLSNHPDYEIINVDKIGIGANPENLKKLENRDRYRFIKGDISDPKLVQEAIKYVDVVVNFAAETHVDRSISDPNPFIESNYIGTFNLLEAERKNSRKIRHIQISTDEVYGDIAKGSFTEIDNLQPSSPYAATKAAADLLCNAYVRTYGMNIIVTRCTNNFGPYQFPEKLIPKTILRAISNLKIPVYGTGEAIRDWLYVLDHCSAIELITNKGKQGEVYNISGGYEISAIKIVRRILDLLGKTEDLVTFVKDRPGHDMRYSLDSTKLRTTLRWRPEHEFNKALVETVDWYLKNEWWWKPIINEKVLHPTPWES
ncbi:MAG: dTDP-glucose 4,6-dehydratase [Candidatus Bathyarchaeota archaeon]